MRTIRSRQIDLPLATEQLQLARSSSPDGDGLVVTGTGEIFIDNLVTPGTKPKVTYDKHGLITGGADLEATDLPLATSTTPGAVSVPATDGAGAPRSILLVTAPSPTPNSASLCQAFTQRSTSTNTATLSAATRCRLLTSQTSVADQIDGGLLDPAVLGPDCITAENMADYATAYMQEASPGEAEYLGHALVSAEYCSTAYLRPRQ